MPHSYEAGPSYHRPDLRLVVLASDVLPPTAKVAQINADTAGDSGVSIGRDRLPSHDRRARLRIAAMKASKHHANIFLQRGRFWLVDTGSTHGTYLLSVEMAQRHKDVLKIPTRDYHRLAEAKKASTPQALGHLDLVHIGGTTMQAHIHPGTCCQACSMEMGEIDLFAHQKDKPAPTREQPQRIKDAGDRKINIEAERRKRMSEMKQVYFGSKEQKAEQTRAYEDRAAARRELNPGFEPPPRPPSPPLVSMPEPQPTKQLDESNVGYRMLVKMGYQAAKADADEDGVDMFEGAKGMLDGERRGLGSRPLQSVEDIAQQQQQKKRKATAEDHREAARRRYDQLL